MRVKTVKSWGQGTFEESVETAVESACEDQLGESGAVERLQASKQEADKLLARLVGVLVDKGIVTPDELLKIIAGHHETAVLDDDGKMLAHKNSF